MVNATALVNFGNADLEIGDWVYSAYPRSAPEYLPLNSATTSYLQASYPVLAALLPGIYKLNTTVSNGTIAAVAVSWISAAYGAGTWVVGSASANIATSTNDGATWTTRVMGAGASSRIAYGAGLFVAAAGGSNVYTSPDGITWTTRAAANAATGSIYFLNGLFVAGGPDLLQTSPDGINWTARTVPLGGWAYITYGAGLYVAYSNDGTNYLNYITSPDGVTWTSRTSPIGPCFGLAFGNGLFMLGQQSSQYYISTDGINWSYINTFNIWGTNMRSITFGNGLFVVHWGFDGSYAYYSISTDLRSGWSTPIATGTLRINTFGVGYGNGVFVTPYNSTSSVIIPKLAAAVGTTNFTLPVVTPVVGTQTFVKAS